MKPSNHWPHSARFFAARTRFQFSTTGTRSYLVCTCAIAASRSGGRHHSLCYQRIPRDLAMCQLFCPTDHLLEASAA